PTGSRFARRTRFSWERLQPRAFSIAGRGVESRAKSGTLTRRFAPPSPAGGRGAADRRSCPVAAGDFFRSTHQRGFLEPADPVANLRRLLELQVAGVLVHLLLQHLQLRDRLGRLKGRVVLAFLRHASLPAAALLHHARLVAGAFHAVHDPLAPRLPPHPLFARLLHLTPSAAV